VAPNAARESASERIAERVRPFTVPSGIAVMAAISATIEVLQRRGPDDPAVQRAQRLLARMHETVTQMLEQLRE
jgi:hypothetical protein